MNTLTIPFENLTMKDVPVVGGKNASLGEMNAKLSKAGIRVPGGFAIVVDAYKTFMEHNTLYALIQDSLNRLNPQNLDKLSEVASSCRSLILNAEFPDSIKDAIKKSYLAMDGKGATTVAVRSSANAEDSETASFAGQHDSYLNVTGVEQVLEAVKKCYASLFNDRAIKYRIDNNVSHILIGQSVGVQRMVRSDHGSAGVAFTIEPETGNKNLIYITGAWGLGESIVQGAVNTDEFYFFKPALEKGLNALSYRSLGSKEQMMVYSKTGGTEMKPTSVFMRDRYVLNDEELMVLARYCYDIEQHYKLPMDIEWAKDGNTGELFILQARPETIHKKDQAITLKEFSLKSKAKPVISGKAVGRGIVSGQVVIVNSLADADKVKAGDILVADITNPDWNALLRKAICIVTNKGGRTSHASIIARELGIPAVVGTLSATERLKDGQVVTVSCANGDEGEVYDGKLEWTEKVIEFDRLSHTNTKPMFILADPQKALQYSSYPNEGVGLLRMEFIISNTVQVHPMALVNFDESPETPEKKQIAAITRHFINKKEYFSDKLAESIGLVASAFYPKEVIVRMSDFKTNEYRKLLGGAMYEPEEENPMIGFRGASRYYNDRYRKGFGLECAAIKKVRNEMGLTNVKVMIPFCRTISEGTRVLETMKEFGLERGVNGLEVYVMAEIPSNILLAEDFAEIFDGFSIGSNDLTQLTLGLDRDSAIVSDLFDESNEAVTSQIRHLIVTAHKKGVKVGLCGQAPSDNPEFAKFLVACSIDSISFNADAILKGIENIIVAEKEKISSSLELIQS